MFTSATEICACEKIPRARVCVCVCVCVSVPMFVHVHKSLHARALPAAHDADVAEVDDGERCQPADQHQQRGRVEQTRLVGAGAPSTCRNTHKPRTASREAREQVPPA